jgi:hypothetical protein
MEWEEHQQINRLLSSTTIICANVFHLLFFDGIGQTKSFSSFWKWWIFNGLLGDYTFLLCCMRAITFWLFLAFAMRHDAWQYSRSIDIQLIHSSSTAISLSVLLFVAFYAKTRSVHQHR